MMSLYAQTEQTHKSRYVFYYLYYLNIIIFGILLHYNYVCALQVQVENANVYGIL